jgi:hypothetical protein
MISRPRARGATRSQPTPSCPHTGQCTRSKPSNGRLKSRSTVVDIVADSRRSQRLADRDAATFSRSTVSSSSSISISCCDSAQKRDTVSAGLTASGDFCMSLLLALSFQTAAISMVIGRLDLRPHNAKQYQGHIKVISQHPTQTHSANKVPILRRCRT